ncbi:MAG TPA: Fe-S cluster assembly protein SufD [Candidatus Polarisedimenticolaceae bacterium]|nr:Fe-S cluster assembly protein SufD [Candidatus Polarisedimenticolaceae bacterium]
MSQAAARPSLWSEAFGQAPSSGPSWLARRRQEAFARFEADGFPRPGDEEWRQTNVAPIAGTPFALSDPRKHDVHYVPSASGSGGTIAFLNGLLAGSASRDLPDGVLVGSLSTLLPTHGAMLEPHLAAVAPVARRPFSALNTAFLREGAAVVVPPKTLVEQPIQLSYASAPEESPTVAHPRTLILVGEGSQVTVVETFHRARAYGSIRSSLLTNAVTELVLGAGAIVHHVRIVDEDGAWHVGAVQAIQERDSRLVSHNICLGAALTRLDIGSKLAGSGAECVLHGLYLAEGHQHVDNHTTLEHASPHCPSREMYKGILSGSARAVFNGRIVVRPDAQKTDAKQSNRNVLLSGEATVFTRPQLEIYADDVKCTHGATIGRLDEQALFYLRARGIGEKEARALLLRAFAAEILEQIPVPALRQSLEQTVSQRLHLELEPA